MKSSVNPAQIGAVFGETVSVRIINGVTVVKVRRKRNMDNPTPNQIAYKRRFKEASRWAKAQADDAEGKAFYESRKTKERQSAYSLALKDFSRPPKVKAIETVKYKGIIGDVIQIDASDEFLVTKVLLEIIDSSGKLIEEGEASAVPGHRWSYVTTVANSTLRGTSIIATAVDRAEHTGSLEVVVQ